MASLPLPDDELDPELAEYAESLDRGEPWKYPTQPGEAMDPRMPNPLVLRVTGVTSGLVKGQQMRFLNGIDRDGKHWSRILGALSLRETLLDGIVKEWDEKRRAFVEVARVGEVQPGERVAIRFRGFSTIKSGPYKGKEVPNLRVDRPDAPLQPPAAEPPAGETTDPAAEDDIPF